MGGEVENSDSSARSSGRQEMTPNLAAHHIPNIDDPIMGGTNPPERRGSSAQYARAGQDDEPCVSVPSPLVLQFERPGRRAVLIRSRHRHRIVVHLIGVVLILYDAEHIYLVWGHTDALNVNELQHRVVSRLLFAILCCRERPIVIVTTTSDELLAFPGIPNLLKLRERADEGSWVVRKKDQRELLPCSLQGPIC